MAKRKICNRDTFGDASLMFTIDASVMVSALRPMEADHAISREFMRLVLDRSIPASAPSLFVPECSAAIARPTGNTELGLEAISIIEGLPTLTLVPITAERARFAAQLAAKQRLRGADAVYVALALELNLLLVTLDREMQERGAAIVTILTPAEAIARLTLLDAADEPDEETT